MIPIRKVKAKQILAGLLKELLLTCFGFFSFPLCLGFVTYTSNMIIFLFEFEVL